MKQLHPRAIWLFFIGFLLRFIPILFLLVVLISMALYPSDAPDDFPTVVWVIAVVIYVAFSYLWARLSYHYYRYELTESAFRKESGVIWKRYTSVPYERIQNIDIHRGLIARLLGLSDLMIQTAGSSAVVTRGGALGLGAEGRLPGVSSQEAESLREDLLSRIGRKSNQGL